MSIGAIALICFYLFVTGPVVINEGKAPEYISCEQTSTGEMICVEKNSQIKVEYLK